MNSLFFELLQVALGTREKLSRVPNAREWQALYDEAERQAVVGVLLGGLERLPNEQLPPLDLKLQWIGETQMMEAEYRQHCKRVVELSSRFRAVGFKSCILKGVTIARYYPMPKRRQCGDIDLWTFGRRKDVMKWLRSQYEIGHNVWHNVGVEIFEDVPVEIHFHPAWLYQPIHNKKLQRFFEEHKTQSMESHEGLKGFCCPSALFDAVFSLVHSYRHLLTAGIGLRHVVDYYYILKALKHEDRMVVNGFIRQLGIIRFAGAMMWVLNEVCSMPKEYLLCEPDETEGRFFLKEMMAGGNFGQSRSDNLGYNRLGRYIMMLRHYPSEVLWMVPWKCWHLCWRLLNT